MADITSMGMGNAHLNKFFDIFDFDSINIIMRTAGQEFFRFTHFATQKHFNKFPISIGKHNFYLVRCDACALAAKVNCKCILHMPCPHRQVDVRLPLHTV